MGGSSVPFLLLLVSLCGHAIVTSDCPEDQYYDDAMDQCAPCAEYCNFPNQPRLFKSCKFYCPKVYNRLTEKAVPQSSSDDTAASNESSGMSLGAIVAIVLVAVIAVPALVTGIVVFSRNRGQRQKSNNNRNQGGGQYRPAPTGVQEEGREKAESERHSHCQGLLTGALCARDSSSRTPAGLQETGQEGRHELALVGSSTESCMQETQPPKAPVTSNVAIHDFHRTQEGPVYL